MQKYLYYKTGINSLNFSCTGSHKRLRIGFVLCLEMTWRVFFVDASIFETLLTHFQKKLKSVDNVYKTHNSTKNTLPVISRHRIKRIRNLLWDPVHEKFKILIPFS